MSNRLQKKCVIAASSVHLLLMLILVVGPAFFSPESKHDKTAEINFVPAILIDEALQGGGSPKGGQAAPPPSHSDPPSSVPKPPEPVVQKPDPKPEIQKPVEPVKPNPKPVETEDPVDPTSAKQQKHQVKVNLTEVKPGKTPVKPSTNNKPNTSNDTSAEDKELAKAVAALKGTASGIRSSSSGSTSIQLGPGGGGPTYASYNAEIQRIYKQRYDLALSAAGSIADDQTSVEASITIARDGTVVSSKITKPSKNAALNKLVERVLDSVSKLRPFPEGAKDSQRTLDMLFDLTPKQGLG